MDKTKAKLILLRHGASLWNEKNIFTGWVDIPLSSKGIEESFQAGKKIAKGNDSNEDWLVMENWRNSHSYIINTFRTTLGRNIPATKKKKIILAQRLKRLSTIVDKLTTGRAKDLATMNDLAGCRLIFGSIKDLNLYRKKLHKASFKHRRINGDRYNYISEPKSTGYRGIHDVYSYDVNSQGGKIYNGLLIEIQYRTNVQHAWANKSEV